MSKILFQGTYSAETLIDLPGDLNYIDMGDIPVDEHGFQEGTFVVTFEWVSDEIEEPTGCGGNCASCKCKE